MKPFAQLLRATSFGRQLGFVVTVTVLSLAFTSSLATSWQSSRQIRATLLEQGRHIAENLARQSKLALVYDAADNANEAIAVTLSFPDVTALEIRHADGRLLVDRNTRAAAPAPTKEKTVLPRQQAYLESESDDAWHFVAPVLAGGGSDSPFELTEQRQETLGYVRVKQSKATLTRMRQEVFGVNFAVSFLFAFAFLIVVRQLTARLTRPLDRLSTAMTQAETGATEVRAELAGPKDIVDMALAFNKMMTALEGRERELRTLLDNLPAAVVVHGPDAAIRYTNPVANTFFGTTWGNGAPWHFVCADGSPMTADEFPVNRVVASRQPLHDYTVGVVRSQGEPPRWMSVSAFPEIDETGNLDQIIVCFVEITGRKQFEEELHDLNESLEQRVRQEVAKNREKDAMLIQQSRLATMGEMMHNVAHQWRQPLSALTVTLANIKDDFEFGEMTRETLDKQLSGGLMLAQKMSSTIDDFRDFFRPDHEKSRFSLMESVREALNLVEASIHASRIEVSVEAPEDVFVEGYANEYSQVLLNVLTNAKDALAAHRPEGGRVTITIERADGMGVVRISDNGGGIPEDVLPKIFDPYFTTKESGTGIGLYMSRMIMSHMQGHIVARNTESGAEIVISVPALD